MSGTGEQTAEEARRGYATRKRLNQMTPEERREYMLGLKGWRKQPDGSFTRRIRISFQNGDGSDAVMEETLPPPPKPVTHMLDPMTGRRVPIPPITKEGVLQMFGIARETPAPEVQRHDYVKIGLGGTAFERPPVDPTALPNYERMAKRYARSADVARKRAETDPADREHHLKMAREYEALGRWAAGVAATGRDKSDFGVLPVMPKQALAEEPDGKR